MNQSQEPAKSELDLELQQLIDGLSREPEVTDISDYDVLREVRAIREAHYAQVKDLSEAERIAFYQEKSERFLARWTTAVQEAQNIKNE